MSSNTQSVRSRAATIKPNRQPDSTKSPTPGPGSPVSRCLTDREPPEVGGTTSGIGDTYDTLLNSGGGIWAELRHTDASEESLADIVYVPLSTGGEHEFDSGDEESDQLTIGRLSDVRSLDDTSSTEAEDDVEFLEKNRMTEIQVTENFSLSSKPASELSTSELEGVNEGQFARAPSSQDLPSFGPTISSSEAISKSTAPSSSHVSPQSSSSPPFEGSSYTQYNELEVLRKVLAGVIKQRNRALERVHEQDSIIRDLTLVIEASYDESNPTTENQNKPAKTSIWNMKRKNSASVMKGGVVSWFGGWLMGCNLVLALAEQAWVKRSPSQALAELDKLLLNPDKLEMKDLIQAKLLQAAVLRSMDKGNARFLCEEALSLCHEHRLTRLAKIAQFERGLCFAYQYGDWSEAALCFALANGIDDGPYAEQLKVNKAIAEERRRELATQARSGSEATAKFDTRKLRAQEN